MYQFSRAIYRELAHEIVEDRDARQGQGGPTNHERVLQACEAAVRRLATDRHYFAKPTRSLFAEIRIYFPMGSQARVYRVVDRYLGVARDYLATVPEHGFDALGNRLQCRATTRKGTACQRVPLSHNGYCPSHQHLDDGERSGTMALAA